MLSNACGRIGVETYFDGEDAAPLHEEPDAGSHVGPDGRGPDPLAEDPQVDVPASPESDPEDVSIDTSSLDASAPVGDLPDSASQIQNESGTSIDAGAPGSLPASYVTCGTYHTCAVFNSRLYCWGSNAESALGSTASAQISLPQSVATAVVDWVQVESGQDFVCARTQSGDVWCWGTNTMGQLGVGDATARSTPTRVALRAAARSISAHFAGACALLTDDSLWCWGDNYEGQLGQADTFPGYNEPTPLNVSGSWSSMSVGQGHNCMLRAPGELWCSGRNSEDELGLGSAAAIQVRTPTRIGTASNWSQVGAGQSYTCAVRADGSLWCWGDNVAGQLGVGDQTARDVPTRVGTGNDWRSVRVDTFHSCGLRAPGTLWCWGRNVEGQLGTGDRTRRVVPTQVGTATDWLDVAVGRFDACARRSDGSLWCTGDNAEGRLGNGDTQQRDTLTLVRAP